MARINRKGPPMPAPVVGQSLGRCTVVSADFWEDGRRYVWVECNECRREGRKAKRQKMPWTRRFVGSGGVWCWSHANSINGRQHGQSDRG